MKKEINVELNFSEKAGNEDAIAIRDALIDCTLASASTHFANTGLVTKFSMDNYFTAQKKTKNALLSYAAEKAGVTSLKTKSDVAMAFSNNAIFTNIINSIMVDALRGVQVNSQSPQLMALCNIVTVDIGDSETWRIQNKGLPVAQRTTYISNVAFLNQEAESSITITPKQYSLGTTIDFIRIVADDYDLGYEIAKVHLGMLAAQYKLIAGLLFSTVDVPDCLVNSTFTGASYMKLKDNLESLNGTKGVTAYGTGTALNAIGAIASTGGYATKDEYIKTGYIGNPFGVQTVMLDQGSDLSAPFTDQASLDDISYISNSYLVLLSNIADKPIKLVRENYIRIVQDDNMKNSLNRVEYSYFQAFDAAIATQQHYAVQAVAAS